MRNVSRNRNRIALWPRDPGRDRPQAASTVQVRLTAVPPALTSVLTHTARETASPENMARYADGSSSRGHITMPPTALIVGRDAKLVTSTDHRGTSTARTRRDRTSALTACPT